MGQRLRRLVEPHDYVHWRHCVSCSKDHGKKKYHKEYNRDYSWLVRKFKKKNDDLAN